MCTVHHWGSGLQPWHDQQRAGSKAARVEKNGRIFTRRILWFLQQILERDRIEPIGTYKGSGQVMKNKTDILIQTSKYVFLLLRGKRLLHWYFFFKSRNIQEGTFFNSETSGCCWKTAQRCNEEENATQRVNGVVKVRAKKRQSEIKKSTFKTSRAVSRCECYSVSGAPARMHAYLAGLN